MIDTHNYVFTPSLSMSNSCLTGTWTSIDELKIGRESVSVDINYWFTVNLVLDWCKTSMYVYNYNHYIRGITY